MQGVILFLDTVYIIAFNGHFIMVILLHWNSDQVIGFIQ